MAHSQQNQVAVNQSAMTSCISDKNHYLSRSGNHPHTQNDRQNNQQAQFSQSFGNAHNQNLPFALSQGRTQVQQQQNYYNQNLSNVAKSSYGSWLSLLFMFFRILLFVIVDTRRQ